MELNFTISSLGAAGSGHNDARYAIATSRMAPGDLSQPVMAANNGTLAAGTKMYWSILGVAAGQPILAEVTSTAFAPVLILLPPSAYNQSNGTFDFTQEIVDSASAGDGRPYLDYTAGQAGTWYVMVGSQTASGAGAFTLWMLTGTSIHYSFVPTALTELDYTRYLDGSVGAVSDTSGGTAQYYYDALDRLVSVTAPAGSGVSYKCATFAYNAASQPTVTYYWQQTGSNANLVCSTFYTTSTGGTGYDGMGRLTNMQESFSGNSRSYSWQYDAASNITQTTSSADGTTAYTLDSSDELKTASGADNEGYSFDQNGNRTGGDQTGAANELLSDGVFNYQYDKDGNLVKQTRISSAQASDWETDYTWDYENRLIGVTVRNNQGGVTSSVSYTYDIYGRRFAATTARRTPTRCMTAQTRTCR